MSDRPVKPPPTEGAAMADPYVVLDVELVGGAFVLVLENIGAAPAYSPRVKFSRKLIGAGGERVISALAIWNQLALLRPGRRIDVFLDAAALVFRRKGSKRFRATVTYTDGGKHSFERRYDHDLNAYRDLPQIEA